MITLPSADMWTLDDFAAFCIDHQHETFLDALKHFMDCQHIYIQTDTPPANAAFDKQGRPVALRQLV